MRLIASGMERGLFIPKHFGWAGALPNVPWRRRSSRP
jgi:hypothetical protein